MGRKGRKGTVLDEDWRRTRGTHLGEVRPSSRASVPLEDRPLSPFLLLVAVGSAREVRDQREGDCEQHGAEEEAEHPEPEKSAQHAEEHE